MAQKPVIPSNDFSLRLADEFPAVNVPSDIIEQCVDLISPENSESALCRDHVVANIRVLKFLHVQKFRFYSATVARPYFFKLAEAAETMVALLRDDNCPADIDDAKYPKDELCVWLGAIAVIAQERADALQSKKSPSQPLKTLSASFAYGLFEEFGSRPPTLTTDGAFFQLAALLFEGATGIAGANLDWQCRTYLQSRKRRQR